jgi:trimeric autotransporter adhesin
MSRSIIGGLLQGITRGSRSADRARHSRRAIHSPWLESLEERALLSTTDVHIVNFSFAPSTVTINIGDTVHWIWDTDDHSTTSVSTDAVQWDSTVLNTGATFDVTFNQAGSFNYYCKIHGRDLGGGNTSGMAGTVVVMPPPTPTSIVVTPANPDVTIGATEQFTAMGTFADGSIHNVTSQVTWSSSNTANVTISNTAGSNGLANALATGTSSITATEGTVSGNTVMRVIAPVASIAVTPADPSLPKGETEHFIATGTLTDNSTVDLTNSVTWSSSSLATASISNAAGSSGAATGLALGTTTITATMGTVSGSTTLTVTAPVLQSITVSPASASIADGSTQQFTATGILSDHTAEDLTNLATWTSSSTSVASVSATGLATGQSAGSSTIGASFQGFSGAATLNVAAPPPPLVTITSIVPVLNKKHQVTSIKVVLSGLVNPAEAQSKIIYRLLLSSKNKVFVAKKAKPIAVKSARYSSATNTIVITPKTLFALSKPVQLSISAGPPIGLEDSLGRFIDGDRNGQPGGNEVAVISKTSVKI